MIRKQITIFPEQAKFIRDEDINLSQFVQRALHERMKE